MWVEDRLDLPPAAFHPSPAAPLDCFGPLARLPAAPRQAGLWEAPSPHPAAGDRMQVIVGPAEGPTRGVVILVPPWKISRARLVAGWERLLRDAGYEVWLAVPPAHMGRTPPGQRSGEPFVSPDLALLRRSVEQQVLELRVLGALARARREPAALIGLSLGGLGAALAATTPEAPPSVALVAAPLDLAAIIGRTRIGRRYRRLAERAGAPLPSPEALAALLAPFDPGLRPLASRRAFVAIGRHDGITTRRASLPVLHGWGILPQAYPRGHLTLLFACREVREDLLRFLGEGGPRA